MTEKGKSRQSLSLPEGITAPGSLDDDSLIRTVLAQVMKESSKSREQIADEMSVLLGRQISVGMLNKRSVASHPTHAFPLSQVRAFCIVTDDWRLLSVIAERLGLRVIDQEEAELLELGRQYLRRRQADAEISKIEDKFGGKR